MLIVTDGAVDVPREILGSPQVCTVPAEVDIDGQPFTGTVEEFWLATRGGRRPATRPPTVAALAEVYRRSPEVIAVHVSGQLSATMARAEAAAALASRPGATVAVVDSRSISVGAGLVIAALHDAASGQGAGCSPADLTALARELPGRLHTFALVQDVGWLRRSDRAGLLPNASLSGNHPLVMAVRGRVVALGQSRQRPAAIRELVRHLRQVATRPGPDIEAWALGHGDAPDIGPVAGQLAEAIGRAASFTTPIDPTVGAHLGPDALVVGAISSAPGG